MAYVPVNTEEDDPEASALGTLPDQNADTIPTESGAPTAGTTPTGGGGVTPSENSAPSVSQATGGVRPSNQSQVSTQGNQSPNYSAYTGSQANQDAIASVGTGIGTTLNNETNDATTATNTGTTNLQTDVNNGAATYDQPGNTAIINNPTNITPAQQAELTKELSGTYTGPTSAASYFADANTPAAKASENAATLESGNLAGPQTYFAGNGVQGQGNQQLDAALFQGSPSAQAAVKPAVLNAQAAEANVSGANLSGQTNIIPEGQTNATATQTATQGDINAGIAGYTAQGNSAAANDITQYNQLAATTTAFLQNPTQITGTPTADQTAALSALGYTVAQWNQLQTAYNDLAQVQYIQNLVKQSGMPITQDPKTGQYINTLTGNPVVFPTNLPPPAGVDLSKGLTVQEASQLFNMGNSANPQIQQDINALEGFLGQSATGAANPTGANGTQFTYAPPELGTNLTAAQTELNNQNNLAQAAINAARANPSEALKSGSTLGVAYAIGGAALAEQVASAGIKAAMGGASTVGEASTLSMGMNNAGANAAEALGASDETANTVGAGLGAVGEALSVIGAAYGIYNFIAGYQSGNSAVDAINGAEAGAAIGSVVFPGIGTVIGMAIGAIVGAVAGLFGYKKDPEQQYWQNYQSAAINAGLDSQTGPVNITANYLPPSQLQELAMSDPTPATTFEGLMDVHNDTGIPMYDQYGRMGGGSFIKDMTTQIDQAATAGKINYYSTPQQIYTQVVAPWISKMGAWSNQNSGAIIALIIAMIGQYTSGNISSWQWINGTNYLAQQTKPFSQFASDTYAPSNWVNPSLPGNTTSNPIAYNNGPAPTQAIVSPSTGNAPTGTTPTNTGQQGPIKNIQPVAPGPGST